MQTSFQSYLTAAGFSAFLKNTPVPSGFTRQRADYELKLEQLRDKAQVAWQRDLIQRFTTKGMPEQKVKAIFEKCLNQYCYEIEEMDSVAHDFINAMECIMEWNQNTPR